MRLNLGLIFAGLSFFALPNFKLFDIMPDFIGAILIITGLSKMYMYDGNFDDTRRSAKYLLWISLLRLVLCVWATSGGRRDYLVPFTFIICVLEAIYMISLFKGLYLGLEYTLMRADSQRLIKKVHEAFTLSFIFVLASRILEFVPEICEIYAQDAELDLSAGASFKMSMAQMKMYIFGVCFVCSLILGIIYLFNTASVWTKVIADKNYAPFLKEKYNNYVNTERDAIISVRLQKVYFLLMAGFVFLFDIYIDGVNFVPSVIGTILFFSASLYLCKYSGTMKRRVFTVAIPAFAASAVCYLFMTRIHLGINYNYALEAYFKQPFSLLESKISIFYASFFAFLEFILVFLLLMLIISQMKSVFAKEKRTVALPMLTTLRISTFFATLIPAIKKILTAIEGYLATNSTVVLDYVKSKAHITNPNDYESLMENPLISQYEKISSISYYLTFISIAAAFICLFYTLRIRRFTEGNYDKKR